MCSSERNNGWIGETKTWAEAWILNQFYRYILNAWFCFTDFEKSLGLSHHPLIKLIALVQEWMLAAKDNHVPGSCLHQRKHVRSECQMSGAQSIEKFKNVGKALPRDIGLSWLLKCVVWISFCPAVSFSRSKRYRCTEISADIDADRPGTNSLYEGTHINTCHAC